jgi:hypothetical protein
VHERARIASGWDASLAKVVLVQAGSGYAILPCDVGSSGVSAFKYENPLARPVGLTRGLHGPTLISIIMKAHGRHAGDNIPCPSAPVNALDRFQTLFTPILAFKLDAGFVDTRCRSARIVGVSCPATRGLSVFAAIADK